MRRLATHLRNRPDLRSAIPPEGAKRPTAFTGWVSQCEAVSEEAATPGHPQRFHVWEPLGSLPFPVLNLAFQLAELSFQVTAAEPDFAITGSATFTLAVIAMSLISPVGAIEN